MPVKRNTTVVSNTISIRIPQNKLLVLKHVLIQMLQTGKELWKIIKKGVNIESVVPLTGTEKHAYGKHREGGQMWTKLQSLPS